MPDVAVLVPSYNHAPFVEKALRSIFAQTLQPKKLIVIDDGSKDESAAIIERTLADCPFDFEFRARANRGLSATLNEGFSASDSEYFAYLGSDDLWLPEFLEEQVKLLTSRPDAVLAFSHAYLIDEEDRIIDCTANWTDYADGDLLPVLLRGDIFLSPGVLYRRSALEKYKWNEDSVLEDYELYLNLTADGEFARNEKVLCAWRQHGWNTSGDFPLMLNEWIAAQDRAAERLKISRDELDKVQSELRFNAVFDHIRRGDRRAAATLFRENISGARSFGQVLKMLARFAVPPTLFRWNRGRKRRATIKKYGRVGT